MKKIIAILALLVLGAQVQANGYGRSFGFRSYSFSAYRVAVPYAPVAFSYAYPVAYPVAAPAYSYGCGGCYGQAAQLPAYQAPACASQLPAYQAPAPCDQAAQLPAYAPPVYAQPYAAVGYSAYAQAFPYAATYFRSYNVGFQRAFYGRSAVIVRGRGFRGVSGTVGGLGGVSAVQVDTRRGLFGRQRTQITAVSAGPGGASVVRARVRR